MGDFLKLVGEVGFPIAGALAAGYFVFLTLKFILEGVTGSVNGLAGIIKALDNRVQTMNNDLVKINNEIAKNNALLRKQAMQELADEQERKRLAMMSPAQKEAYARAKAQAKKAEHDRQVTAKTPNNTSSLESS